MAQGQVSDVVIKVFLAFFLYFFMEIASLFWADIFVNIPSFFLYAKGVIFVLAILYFLVINQSRGVFVHRVTASHRDRDSAARLEKRSYFYLKCAAFLTVVFALFLLGFIGYFSNSIYNLCYLESDLNNLRGDGVYSLDIFTLNMLATTAAFFYIMRNIFLAFGYNYAAAGEQKLKIESQDFYKLA